jgi:hypothetical protein
LPEQVATELTHDLVKIYTPNVAQNITAIDIAILDEPDKKCSGGAGLVTVATGNEEADPTENGACPSIQAKRDNMVLQFTSDGTVQPGPGFTAEVNCLNVAPTHPDDVVALAALAAANPDCKSCELWATENPCELNHAMDGTLAKLGGRAGVRGLPKQDGTETDENDVLELYPTGELADPSKSSMVISCRPEGEAGLMPDGVRNDVCKYYKNEANEPRPNSLAWLSPELEDALYWWETPVQDSSAAYGEDDDENPVLLLNSDGMTTSPCNSIIDFEFAAAADYRPKRIFPGRLFDEDESQNYLQVQSHMQ